MKLGLLADRSTAAVAHRVRHLRVSGLALAAVLCFAAAPCDAASRDATPHAKHLAKAKAAKAKAARGNPAEAVKAAPVVEEKTAERVAPTGVWTSGEGDRACYKGRRKLWQDGQGWVVKRVAVCP